MQESLRRLTPAIAAVVPTYSVFGLRLASDIDLPEAYAEESPDHNGSGASAGALCVLRHSAEPAPVVPHRLLGEEVVYGDVKVRSYQVPSGLRLVYDDTGTFDISGNGGEVVWWAAGQSATEAVRTDVLGRVLAMALHGRGILTLHASAVSIHGAGVVFLAPKGFGKSSLAAALLQAGARLISDDTVAVANGAPPRLHPGIQTLRLREDIVARYVPGREPNAGEKLHYRPPESNSVGVDSTPLRALYLLEPASPSPDEPAVTRERQSLAAATISLTTFRKLGALLDGESGITSFMTAADLVQKVPVYTLRVQRSLGRLEEVVTQLVTWHAAVPAAR